MAMPLQGMLTIVIIIFFIIIIFYFFLYFIFFLQHGGSQHSVLRIWAMALSQDGPSGLFKGLNAKLLQTVSLLFHFYFLKNQEIKLKFLMF